MNQTAKADIGFDFDKVEFNEQEKLKKKKQNQWITNQNDERSESSPIIEATKISEIVSDDNQLLYITRW